MNKNICEKCNAEIYLNLNVEKDKSTFQFTCEIQEKIDKSKLIGIPGLRGKETIKKVIHEVNIPKKYETQIFGEWGKLEYHEAMNFKCFSKIEPNKSCPYYIEQCIEKMNHKDE